MPTYEYVCKDCENHWEEVQKISDPPLEICPKCGKSSARRQISGGNFILKGGGWYADLYSSPSASAKKADANGASESKSDSSSKSADTKSNGASSSASSSSGSGSKT
jgi:putative FmdB family regulatory protein